MDYNDKQFDASRREQDLVKKRAQLRAQLRSEFVKQATNPHVHGHGGVVFDSAIQRWISMNANHYHYFKRNPKTFIYPAIVFSSILGIFTLIHTRRTNREMSYRRGEVAYRDRYWKFCT